MSEANLPILIVSTALPIMLISAAAIWLLLRRGQNGPVTLEAGGDGATAVPVRELIARGGFPFFTKTRNSLKPRLSIEPSGIRFRVLKESYWPFDEIEQIDARKALFGVSLIFVNGTQRNTLTANLRDVEIVRQALAALPPGLPLTQNAAALRD